MSSCWLTYDEVAELTARKRWSAQRKALVAMGVKFTPNAAGRPLVARDAVFGATGQRQPRKAEPDWSAINGTQTKA